MRKLRDQGLADRKGSIIPLTVTSGQLHWSLVKPGATTKLVGRMEIISRSGNVSSSFSCGLCCPDSGPYSYLSPGYPQLIVNGFAQINGESEYHDCYGGVSATGGAYIRSWACSNPAVLGMSGTEGYSCTITGLTAGYAPMNGVGETIYEWEDGGFDCSRSTVVDPPVSGEAEVFQLRITVPDAPLSADASETSASIIARQGVTMRLEAINSSGQLATNVNVGVSFTSSRALHSSETGFPSTFNITSGSYVRGVTLNRVNGTESGTTFRFAISGQTVDYFLYTYFQVIASRLGLVGGTTGCQHVIQSNDRFVSFPSTGICNTGVTLRNGGLTASTTVREVGPWFPHSVATSGNPCVGPNDPYWSTGGLPRVLSESCDANNAGIDLADGTAADLGITGLGTVLWRFQ